MATRKAVVHKALGVAGVETIPMPEPRDEYILVKNKAVALNPTDWKSLKSRFAPGAVSGCDYSGVVEQVGSAVTNGLKVGDRVAGLVAGGNDAQVRTFQTISDFNRNPERYRWRLRRVRRCEGRHADQDR